MSKTNITLIRFVLAVAGMIIAAYLALLGSTPAHAQTTWHVDDSVNDGLVAHWKFDPPLVPVSTTLDFVGTAHGIALNGAALAAGAPPPLQVPDPAYFFFDGVDSRVEIADNAALNLATNFTLAGWARRAITNSVNFLALYDSGEQSNEWWIFIADGGAPDLNDRLGFGERGVGDVFSSDANFNDTNWHHFAVVKNGDSGANLTFYVDGVQRGTAAVGAVTLPSGPKQIGILQDGTFLAPMDGFLDDLRLYNRPLSAVEVQRLAQGKGCVTDGLAWATALHELQCALTGDADGDTIKIARGIYRPGTDPSVPFTLDRGATLLGGYDGVGAPNPDNRAPFDPNSAGAALSVLTGDVLFDDNPATFANYADNAFNVITVTSAVAPTLDGIQVRGGNAVKPLKGGGMLVAAGTPGMTLTNVAFFANRTTASGGALFAAAPLTIASSTFTGNSGGGINDVGSGGAIAITATLQLSNTNFLSNTMQGGNGGAIDTSASLNVTGGLFQNNIARPGGLGGGGAINSSAPLTISAASFVRNLAGGDGGAVSGSAGQMLVTDSAFTQNQANSAGGAVSHTGPVLEIRSSTFQSNTTRFFGGAVQSGFNQVARIVTSTFVGNSAQGANCLFPPPTGPLCTPTSGRGAAIAAFGQLFVEGGTFTNNQAKIDGGAIAALGPATVRNVTITQNKAGSPPGVDNAGLGHGGGVFASNVITIEGGTIAQNEAQMDGGGVYITGTGNITGVLFSLNRALVGGGLHASGPVTVTAAQFSDNTAANGAGGAFARGSAAISGTLFAHNVTTGTSSTGGGLFIQNGPAIVATSIFTGNSTVRFGGGARLAFTTIIDSYFGHNQALTNSEGGGLYAGTDLTVTHTIFESNSSRLSGAIALDASQDVQPSVLIADSLFVDNQNASSSGVADMRLFDLHAQIVNNTLANPNVVGASSMATFRSNVQVTNNIYANYGVSVSGDFSSTLTEDHNLFFNAPIAPNVAAGGGSLSGDPLFANAAARNFRLAPGSPAIDAGADAALLPSITTDLDRLPRLFDVPAVVGAGIVDMGAYEFRAQSPLANAGGPYVSNEGSAMALDGSGSTAVQGVAAYSWDCANDGVFEINATAPTGNACTYPDNGSFTVALRVTGSDGLTGTTTAAVTVNNLAPVVVSDSATTLADTPVTLAVLANDTDVPADPLSVGAIGIPSHGTATTDGASVTYTPAAHYVGPDSFPYTVVDGDGGSASATVAITVTAIPGGADAHGIYLPVIVR